jgi:uracil-DNA glycosylase
MRIADTSNLPSQNYSFHMNSRINLLIQQVQACTICAEHLPLGPRPILRIHPNAKILIVGQAPGIRVHQTGLPFNDPSGDRLRDWMGIGRDIFYDATRIAFLPMGLCYPGTGKRGDLPPRKECAVEWRKQLLAELPNIQFTLAIGQYAQAWHIGAKSSVTQNVKDWKKFWPKLLPLPHPSPRNNLWLKQNPWFCEEILPALKEQVNLILN